MITVLVLEDERKVYELLSQVLRKEGYSFMDEPQSGGLIKIVKKESAQPKRSLGERILEFKNNLLFKEKEGLLYREILKEVERPLIESVLERTHGNQVKAAKILGINRNTLRAKMKRLGIDSGVYK